MPNFSKNPVCRSLNDFIHITIKIIFFRGRNELSDPTWFLYVLFICSITYVAIVYVLNVITYLSDKLKYVFRTIVAVIFIVIGYIMYLHSFNSLQIGTVCTCMGTFHIGNQLKGKMSIKSPKTLSGIVLVSVLFLCLMLGVSNIEIRVIDNVIVNPIYYVFSSLAGWFLIFSISRFVVKLSLIKRIFVCIGKNSLYVLCMHLVCFKLVAYIHCLFQNIPIENVSNFPVVNNSGFWCIAYTLIGLIIPIVIVYLIRQLLDIIKGF